MPEAVGGLANFNGQWAGDEAGLRACLQPTWEKSSTCFPVKGTMGWISGEGAEWSAACMVCSCLWVHQKKALWITGCPQVRAATRWFTTQNTCHVFPISSSSSFARLLPAASTYWDQPACQEQLMCLSTCAPLSRGGDAVLRSSTSPKNEMLPFCVTNLMSDGRDEGKCVHQAQVSLQVSAWHSPSHHNTCTNYSQVANIAD